MMGVQFSSVYFIISGPFFTFSKKVCVYIKSLHAKLRFLKHDCVFKIFEKIQFTNSRYLFWWYHWNHLSKLIFIFLNILVYAVL